MSLWSLGLDPFWRLLLWEPVGARRERAAGGKEALKEAVGPKSWIHNFITP